MPANGRRLTIGMIPRWLKGLLYNVNEGVGARARERPHLEIKVSVVLVNRRPSAAHVRRFKAPS
jgi:hypothetical protein